MAAGGLARLRGGVEGEPQRESTPRPSPVQLAWQEAELGLVYHYDLHVFDGVRYNQRANRRLQFQDPGIFDPKE